jgi:hypothetical protein
MNISAGDTSEAQEAHRRGGGAVDHAPFNGEPGNGLGPSQEDRFPMMRSIRKEVRQFMHAAETLLGPFVGQGELSQDERGIIDLYIQQIVEKFPRA